jgi:hypothetical protein
MCGIIGIASPTRPTPRKRESSQHGNGLLDSRIRGNDDHKYENLPRFTRPAPIGCALRVLR